jgi:extracellular elastinolytic metalloproteinase
LLDATPIGLYSVVDPYSGGVPSQQQASDPVVSSSFTSDDHDDVTLPHYLPPQFDLHDLNTGYLTAPAAGDPVTIARNYMTAHAADMGLLPGDVADLEVLQNYTTDTTGITHLGFGQRLNGLVVENTVVNVNVTADGKIINVAGYFVRDIASYVSQSAPQPTLTALEAVSRAAEHFGLTPTAVARVLEQRIGINRWTNIDAPGVSTDDIPAYLHYVATESGVQLAWDLTIQTPDGQHWYNVAIDAADGSLAHGQDYVHHADYVVYAMPAESPNHTTPPGTRTTVTDPWVFTPTPAVVPSPFGWHDTNGVAGAEFTYTRGNNVYAYLDENANNQPDIIGDPDGGPGLNFNFPIDLTQGPDTYKQAAVTNLFYWNNILHDVHYLYGFTESARNFQTNNYGRGGVGNDAVNAEAQDGSGTNNANFATPPDGSAPRMQMFEWTFTNPRRDSDLDAGVIIHEYGHGVSNRLTGTGGGISALQSRGMGEGWSDYYALMFTQGSTAPTTTTSRGIGTYVLGQATTGVGIRQYAYNFTIANQNLETFINYNSNNQVHAVGTRWCSALWDLTVLLVQKYGYEANLYNSTSTAGNIRALHLVMNGLKLQPANPSFIQARDAILQADINLYGGANQAEIWAAFAHRGLGVNAFTASSSSTTLTTDFNTPWTVTIEATDANAAEPADTGTFTITRTGPTTGPLAVQLTVGGTATNGVDYSTSPRRRPSRRARPRLLSPSARSTTP